MLNLQSKPVETSFELKNENNKQNGNGDVKNIMQILEVTDDIDLQVKFFSILAVHILSQSSCKSDIIMSNLMYEKIYAVLIRGSQLKSTITMNFLTALLYTDDGAATASRARSLALHAQHMVRTSGSLALMTDMFTSSTLHQETWRALCRCLAECCRDCHDNQSYCSHLVPLVNNQDSLS